VIHVFWWDRAAIAVPPGGSPLGQQYRLGAWICVMRGALLAFAVRFDMDHGDDCPGLVRS
jgi:hypothetical protein